MQKTNIQSITTIENLYDIMTIFFTSSKHELKKAKSDLQRARPDDEELNLYFEYARTIFYELRKNFSELDEFFDAEATEKVVRSEERRVGKECRCERGREHRRKREE